MIIHLEDVNDSGRGAMFIGGRMRKASATSVKFLDATRLVVCSLHGQRMYLIRCDHAADTYAIESFIVTQYEGKQVCTDLLDYDGGDLLATSNVHENSVSLYRVTPGGIEHFRDIPVAHPGARFCHGMKFMSSDRAVLCTSCTSADRNVYFVSATTGEVLYCFNDPDWRPKDVCFIDDQHLIVAYTKGAPVHKPGKLKLFPAKAALVQFDINRRGHRVLSETEFPDCQFECAQFADGRLYITNQVADCVMVCRVCDNKVIPERTIAGYSLPHGLDVYPPERLIAVTNYGDNTVVIRSLAETQS